MRTRRAATRGFTAIEVMIAAALLSVIVAGILVMGERLRKAQLALDAKEDAEAQGNVFFQRTQAYFRSRMALSAACG